VAGTVVVGYDGSEGAKAALAEAVRLAQATGESLAVVFGYEPAQRGAGETADLRHAIEAIGQGYLDEALAAVAGRVEAEGLLVGERGADALLSVAEQRGASFIAVGATDRGPLAGAVLGSVPHRLVNTTRVPLLVVPPA
jgi:nucleotide-binding universal stress UspA family protein